MITPNKFVPLDRSALGKVSVILEALRSPVPVNQLFATVERHFDTIDDFILTLDVLYVLKRVDIDLRTGMTRHVA